MKCIQTGMTINEGAKYCVIIDKATNTQIGPVFNAGIGSAYIELHSDQDLELVEILPNDINT